MPENIPRSINDERCKGCTLSEHCFIYLYLKQLDKICPCMNCLVKSICLQQRECQNRKIIYDKVYKIIMDKKR
jgi:hypothetical protein